jgi:anthranilate phosphoribosyltransferase
MSGESAVRDALARIAGRADLPIDQSEAVAAALIDGNVPDPLATALLTALRVKGEAPSELVGFARAARARMIPLECPAPLRPIMDTCGTGGDGARTINVSTATALLVAAAGVRVAKHGNRSVTSNSGSADVLEVLGIVPEVEPALAARCLEQIGIAFLFAPKHHPGFKQVGPIRRSLPFPTIFNLVGPLANPARPEFQLVGVPNRALAKLVAESLLQLGITRAAVVTGGDGLDEITLDGPTHASWIEGGAIAQETWNPDDFGLGRVSVSDLKVSGPAESARRIEAILVGRAEPARDVILANAAAALRVAGRASTLAEGVAIASEAIATGSAIGLLERWRSLTGPTRLDQEYAI